MFDFDEIKELTVCVAITLSVLFVIGVAGYTENHYTIDATVADTYGDTVEVVDNAGYKWFFNGTDYIVGERVRLYFRTNGTDTRLDDEVYNATK